MSNWKRAYGWSGHILASVDEIGSEHDDAEHNLILIPDAVFDRIAGDQGEMKLPGGVRVEVLGVLNTEYGKRFFLAAGHPATFSEGFRCFGTVLQEAELRVSLSIEDRQDRESLDDQYLAAMKERYGLDLPPCRLMVGCSSEH